MRLSIDCISAIFEGMETKSFKEIRKQYPNDDDFLVLVDCDTRVLPTGELEVLGAKYVHAYKTGREMYDAYRDLAKKGLDAHFLLPSYKDNFIMEQRFSMRLGRFAVNSKEKRHEV
jgi:hypothetical protein